MSAETLTLVWKNSKSEEQKQRRKIKTGRKNYYRENLRQETQTRPNTIDKT